MIYCSTSCRRGREGKRWSATLLLCNGESWHKLGQRAAVAAWSLLSWAVNNLPPLLLLICGVMRAAYLCAKWGKGLKYFWQTAAAAASQFAPLKGCCHDGKQKTAGPFYSVLTGGRGDKKQKQFRISLPTYGHLNMQTKTQKALLAVFLCLDLMPLKGFFRRLIVGFPTVDMAFLGFLGHMGSKIGRRKVVVGGGCSSRRRWSNQI